MDDAERLEEKKCRGEANAKAAAEALAAKPAVSEAARAGPAAAEAQKLKIRTRSTREDSDENDTWSSCFNDGRVEQRSIPVEGSEADCFNGINDKQHGCARIHITYGTDIDTYIYIYMPTDTHVSIHNYVRLYIHMHSDRIHITSYAHTNISI
eukprot:2155858-Pleurochrysis_carterae.AAC.5